MQNKTIFTYANNQKHTGQRQILVNLHMTLQILYL